MIEAGAVIGLDGNPLFWHLPPGRTGGSIPDTRSLWDVLWEHRKGIAGFAHSHPGGGVPHPSHTDWTSFEAIESGLGRALNWWIISSECTVLIRRESRTAEFTIESVADPVWAHDLRKHSNI